MTGDFRRIVWTIAHLPASACTTSAPGSKSPLGRGGGGGAARIGVLSSFPVVGVRLCAAVQSEPGLLSKTHPAEKGPMPSSSGLAMGVSTALVTGARAAFRVRRSQTGWLHTANLGVGASWEVDRVLVERLFAAECGRAQAGVRHLRLLDRPSASCSPGPIGPMPIAPLIISATFLA